MVRKYDRSSKRTTLINDDVRVYKGGSWRDRAYWLDPAQRRYFPQDMATDYIGFRCAMSRVVRNLTEGKHRGISFYKITIKALLLGLFFNRF
jgi:gliding motility-associated lipoprotein GldJ